MPKFDRDELMAKARALTPLLETEADEAEAQRTLTRKTVDALIDSGLADIMTPELYGGSEADPVTQALVFEETARADGAAGWCHMAAATSTAVAAAYCSDEAASQMFDGKVGVMLGGHAAPLGQGVETDGGFRLSGSWRFGSGTAHCPWLLAGFVPSRGGSPVLDDAGIPALRVAVVPRDDANFLDNWHTLGLVGTGSYDYEVKDVFVGAGFTFPLMDPVPLRGGPVYRLGMVGLVASGHAAFALGVARRALDEIARIAPGKQRGAGPRLSERMTFLRDYAEAEAKLRAARLLVLDTLQEAFDWAQENATPDKTKHNLVRLATRYATDVAAEVTEFAYRAAGTESLRTPNLIQRCLRDILAGTQHAFVYEENYLDAARDLLAVHEVNA